MNSTTEAEDLVIDPKLLEQLENLESQCNPDFDLGFDEWLATQNTGAFEEQLNSLSAEENCSCVTDGIQPQPKKPKLSLSLKKEATAVEGGYKHGMICLSGDGRGLQWGWKRSDTSEYEAVKQLGSANIPCLGYGTKRKAGVFRLCA